jgi:replication-associated recombination protein RarA
VSQEYFPPRLAGRKYYVPSEFGFEKIIEKRIRWWEERRRGAAAEPGRHEPPIP